MTRAPRFAAPIAALVPLGLVLALATAPAPVRAQEQPDKVIASIEADTITIAPGGMAEARVTIRLAPGHHILADPVRNRWMTPATLVFESAKGVIVRGAKFPEPQKIHDSDSTIEYPVWSGTIHVTVPIAASPRTSPGEHVLNGLLRYQAVYGGEYYKVATRKVELRVRIKADGKSAPAGGGTSGAATRP